jgi:hypothetical protein
MAEEKRPYEDLFHKYPVLRIPTGRCQEELIIGREKAIAVLKYIDDIREFVARHQQEAS